MKKIAVIPARFAATRFPGKLMQLLGDKPVIVQTYLATIATQLFDDVIIATDSEVIKAEVEQYGATVFQSQLNHESGTDRIAEAVQDLNADVVVNVQGDTPFVQKEALQKLIHLFEDPSVEVASLMEIIADDESLKDPNVVKVCINKKNQSLFFSRSLIPYPRNIYADITHYKHIGVYAFRKEALIKFTQWEVTPLEDAEKIECLRFLEHGILLKMALTEPMGIDINSPEDLKRAQLFFNK